MSLTKHTYVQSAGQVFQNAVISKETVGNGTLRQRFDLKAFPQKGIRYDGTDFDGNAVPAPAKTVYP